MEHGEFWCSGGTSEKTTFPGLLLSPSLGNALRDWVRRFTGDVERGGSGTTPGRKLKETKNSPLFIIFIRYSILLEDNTVMHSFLYPSLMFQN